MFDAVKTSMSGRSKSSAVTYLVIVPLAAATYPVIVPLAAVDSDSALPDLRPSAMVALRAPPALSDAPWVRHPLSVELPLPLLDGFPWLLLPERWRIWKMFDAAKTSMSGWSRPAAATYPVIVRPAAVDSGSALPDL